MSENRSHFLVVQKKQDAYTMGFNFINHHFYFIPDIIFLAVILLFKDHLLESVEESNKNTVNTFPGTPGRIHHLFLKISLPLSSGRYEMIVSV